MSFPAFDAAVFRMLLPILFPVIAGCVVMGVDSFYRSERKGHLVAITLLGLAGSLVSVVTLWGRDPSALVLGDMLVIDRFALFACFIFIVSAAMAVCLGPAYLERQGFHRGEYYILILFSVTGMMTMVSAADLLVLFLGLETMSIPVYILTGFRRSELRSNEGAMKYFIMGAFASAVLLYGIALTYGAVGSTNMQVFLRTASGNPSILEDPLRLLGMGFILGGFAFKVASVPFHMWAPDVYEGAATPVTGFMATAVKAAAFVAFVRVFKTTYMDLESVWGPIVWWLAVLTMTVGNLAAITQLNLKRMLAFSSIAHAGYLLIGVASLSTDPEGRAVSAILFYLVAYLFMTAGAFAVIGYLEKRGHEGTYLESYNGLGFAHPFLGVAMSVFMFSLAGIPPTAGFFGKYYLFGAAVQDGKVGLAVLGVLNSALSLYYYLRVVVAMYMARPREAWDPLASRLSLVVILISVVGTLWIGFGFSAHVPGLEEIIAWTNRSALVLR
jgi:NADH-quinone oxidoreductase subunit N